MAAEGGEFTLMGGFIQMVASLALVVGVIFLFHYISNRWLKNGPVAGSGPRYIRLIETRYLAPKKSLMLVEVSGEYLLLSNSGEGMQFIKQIDMLEEIEVIEAPDFAKLVPGGVRDKLRGLAAMLPNELPRYMPVQKKSGARP
jgi:flagellar protein FliO/FliZ